MSRRFTWLEGILIMAALGFFFAWCDRGSAIGRLQRAVDAKTKPAASAFPVESGSDVMAFKLALANSRDFERAHSLHPAFQDCRPAENDTYVCSTFTDEGSPVRFRCDHEGCVIECGAAK